MLSCATLKPLSLGIGRVGFGSFPGFTVLTLVIDCGGGGASVDGQLGFFR